MLRYGTVRTRRKTTVSYLVVGPDKGGWITPVLLVHPINLRKECWLDLVRLLASDHLCIALDLADHGESTDGAETTLGGWVSDCQDVVDAVELDTFHVVGGSLGGLIALCLASVMPTQVLSVTTMGSSLGGGNASSDDAAGAAVRMLDNGTVDELFAVLAVEALAPGASPELVTTVRRLTNSHGADIVRRTLIAATRADAAGWLPGVNCPVLVLTGEHDKTCPPEDGRQMAASVRGCHQTLAAVGHLPMLEDAEAVAKLVVPHLEAAKVKAECTAVPKGRTP